MIYITTKNFQSNKENDIFREIFVEKGIFLTVLYLDDIILPKFIKKL